MPPAGFEPSIPASERQQTHALDRAATGIGAWEYDVAKIRSAVSEVKHAEGRKYRLYENNVRI
jgi:hypothetical protein